CAAWDDSLSGYNF
nr:immunoglobulin light chain junction region [Macaca mulatta]